MRRRNQACQRCKTKKLKCDGDLPACRSCVTSSQQCLMIDPITKREYARDYVSGLENRILELQSQPPMHSLARVTPGTHQGPSNGPVTDTPSADEQAGPQESPASQYVGDSSEINFTQLIIANSQTRSLFARSPNVAEMFQSIRVGKAAVITATPNSLPDPAVALELIKSYLTGEHILCPIISRYEILETYNAVYQDQWDESTSSSLDFHHHHLGTSQDLYRLNLIFSVGSLNRSPLPCEEETLGYFVAAMQHFDRIPKIMGIDAVRNLLLLAQLTMLRDTGSSVWDITRICMRTCIMLDLHQGYRGDDKNSGQHQPQELVFWACYTLDRIASTALGRPFAISDADISAPIPTQEAYCSSLQTLPTTSFGPSMIDQLPSENSMFVLYVDLRRLSSEISTYFYRIRRTRTSIQIYEDVRSFLSRMETWHQTAKVFANWEGVLYHGNTWLDYAVAKEKLSLARASINFAISPGEGDVPRDLRDLCLNASLSTIETYAAMFRAGKVVPSRLYFFVLFSATVSCIYCILVECGDTIGFDIEQLDLSSGSETMRRVMNDLDMSVQTLRSMSNHLKDLKGYSGALDVVISQMRGPRSGLSFGADIGISEEAQQLPNPMMADIMQPDGALSEHNSSFNCFGFAPTGQTNWQSIGSEMWQLIEPDWLDMPVGDGNAGDLFNDVNVDADGGANFSLLFDNTYN